MKNDSLKGHEEYDYTSTVPAKFLDKYDRGDVNEYDEFMRDWLRWSNEIQSSIEEDSLQVIYKNAFDKVVIQLGRETLFGRYSFRQYRILPLDTSVAYHSGFFGNREGIDDNDVYKTVHFTPVIKDNANNLYWSRSIASTLGDRADELFSTPFITSLDIYQDGVAVSYSSSRWSHMCYFFPKDPSLHARLIYMIMD